MERISILSLTALILLTSCSSSKIMTVEFQTIDYQVVSGGDFSQAKQKNVISDF